LTKNVEPISQAQPDHFSSDFPDTMSANEPNISTEEFEQLRKKFSEIKHSINNALAVMMALSEMSQRRPDYSEKLASTVLTKAPQIVAGLQEFTLLLNEKAGFKAAGPGPK
jgi:chromosome condensin MukBEF ATPase and DNA-binding subunit MukB